MQTCVNTSSGASLLWERSRLGKARRGRRFAIFMRLVDRAEETGTLSVLTAFFVHEIPRASLGSCFAPQVAAGVRGGPALSGSAWEGSRRKWCLWCPLLGNLMVMFFISPRSNVECVKRLLRVGCLGSSWNTSLKEKLKQQMNKMIVV